MNNSDTFPPDRTWGTIFIVLYGLMLVFFLLVILAISGSIAFAGNSAGHPVAMPLFGAAFAGIVGMFLLFSLGVHIVGAVGIHRSRAWGFWLTIILSVLTLVSSSGSGCLTIVPLVYSILRLAGAYGPKPV